MAYDKGNFYHENGVQVIDGALLKNCGGEELAVGEAKLLYSKIVPTTELLAPVGSLCICTASNGVALYINQGTDTVPSWKKISTEA